MPLSLNLLGQKSASGPRAQYLIAGLSVNIGASYQFTSSANGTNSGSVVGQSFSFTFALPSTFTNTAFGTGSNIKLTDALNPTQKIEFDFSGLATGATMSGQFYGQSITGTVTLISGAVPAIKITGTSSTALGSFYFSNNITGTITLTNP